MTYRFTLFLDGVERLDDAAADVLYEAGCDDGTPFSRCGEAGVGFDREADTLEAAIVSAVSNVRDAGFAVDRVEVDPADVPAALSA